MFATLARTAAFLVQVDDRNREHFVSIAERGFLERCFDELASRLGCSSAGLSLVLESLQNPYDRNFCMLASLLDSAASPLQSCCHTSSTTSAG